MENTYSVITNENLNKNILAIDPSLTSTGFAVLDKNNIIIKAGRITTEANIDTTLRMKTIAFNLFEVAIEQNVFHVILEDGFIAVNKKTGLLLAQLRGFIIGAFETNNYYTHSLYPTEIRKAFMLKGNANKQEVAQAIVDSFKDEDSVKIINNIGPYSDKELKSQPKTSDIYDAISIGSAFLKIYGHEIFGRRN